MQNGKISAAQSERADTSSSGIERPQVALAISPRIAYRFPDRDAPEISNELHRHGVSVDLVPWYDDVDWTSYSLVIVRSPWDLYWHLDDFVNWMERVGSQTTVLNPPDILRWSLDKRYMRQLAEAGVSIVPTTFVECGEQPVFPSSKEFVVKPVMSGGSMLAARYTHHQVSEAAEHVRYLHEKENLAAIVQPYLPSVDDATGERALLYYNGKYDHAIRKGGVLKLGETLHTERKTHPNRSAYEPTDAEYDLATRAIGVALKATGTKEPMLYSRVDIASDTDGSPTIMELELLDPELFLALSEGSTQRYASAIIERLGVERSSPSRVAAR